MREKRKSVQNNKVFIFIDVLHLGETGSLTKLNVVYVALIKQAVVKRRRSECSTHSNALDDV
jgi:hypothetical protein